jgi:hypothetical protein
MRFEYTVTLSDFEHSLRAWRQLSLWRRVKIVFYYVIFPLMLVVTSGAEFLVGKQSSSDRFIFYILAAACLALATFIPILYWLRVRSAYKQRLAMTKGKPLFVEYDSEGIRLIVTEGADVRYKWSAFTGVTDDESVATFFVTDAAFHTIPKRAMPEESWSEVYAYLAPFAGKK